MPRSVLVLGTALLCLLMTSCGSSNPDSGATTTPTVDVSQTDCGSGWHPTSAGEQHLKLHNSDSNPGEVQVVGLGSHHGLVYADVEPFGPNTTVALDVPLAAGRYALACLMEDSTPVVGPARTITGSETGAPGVRILTQAQLVRATLAYSGWVLHNLPTLVHATRRLDDLVNAGDLVAARRAWVTAHLDYQRLGAAYEAFGDLGERVDGLPQGLPGGVHNPHWAGFHRVERELYGTAGRSRLTHDTDALLHAVTSLPVMLKNTQLDPTTLTLRAHEIAENALQFQLTGEDDFGSHSDLASVRAELVGTGVVLHALRGPIDKRVPQPGRIRSSLRQTLALFTHASRTEGRVPVARLPRREREQLDAALSGLCERLAPIPATLEPRLVATQSQNGVTNGGTGG
jgi:iron uptake system component EfeO